MTVSANTCPWHGAAGQADLLAHHFQPVFIGGCKNGIVGGGRDAGVNRYRAVGKVGRGGDARLHSNPSGQLRQAHQSKLLAQRSQQIVGLDLLLDARKRGQLDRKVRRINWIQRVLILHLSG